MGSLKILCCMLAVVFLTHSVNAEATKEMKLVGSAKMKYFLWDVYKAELFAPNGNYKEDGDFELRLTYLMKLDGEDIAERSIKEMKGIGANDKTALDKWQAFMTEVFPDVKKGSVLSGIKSSDNTVTFLSDDKPIGEIKDSGFAHYFFGIWLDEKTSEPDLREKLLGLDE